jgi:hypothetical protein
MHIFPNIPKNLNNNPMFFRYMGNIKHRDEAMPRLYNIHIPKPCKIILKTKVMGIH